MNVIVVNDYAAINGGAAKVAIDSAIGLAKNGFQVVYFAAVGPIEPALTKSGIKVICLQQQDILNDPKRLRAAIRGIWNMLAAKQMADLLCRYSPDNTIVHVHGWTKALTSSPIRVAIKHGFKVVLTLHDYFIACPNGGFYDYPGNSVCNRLPLSFSCVTRNCDARNYSQKIWRVIRQIIQKHVGKIPFGISGFIAISNFSLEILRDYLPSTSTITLIQNPVATDRKTPVDVASNRDFVFVGRLSREKGVELFAEAMKQLDYKGIIVGGGPLESMLRINYPEMLYTGWVSSDHVYKILQKVRALVFPSLCFETQGLIVLEAMSLGIPVIVPNTAAAREFVVDGKTGLWFKGGDVIDLEKKMMMLCENSELTKNLGRSAYDRFWENPFDLQLHIDSVKQYYIKILMGVKFDNVVLSQTKG